MTKNAIAAIVGSVCTLSLSAPSSPGQTLSGTSLSVTGTGTINTLVSGTANIGLLMVTGTADFQENTLLFGVSGTNPGVFAVYDDGTSGANSSLTLTAMRHLAAWNWRRVTASGTATAIAMQLDAFNRLILTGTAANNPPQIVLDPNGTTGSVNVLTQGMADNRYVVNGGASDTTLSNTTISGNVTITGDLGVSGQATLNGSSLLTQDMANGLYVRNSCINTGYVEEAPQWPGDYGFTMALGGGSATAPWAFAGFDGAVASAPGAKAFGRTSNATNYDAVTLGMRANASGAYSIASGAWSTANGIGSNSIGYMTTAQGLFQTVVGINNVPQGDAANWVPTDDLFVIGNGTLPYTGGWWAPMPLYDSNGDQLPDAPSNAFVVKKNGNTIIYGNLTVSGSSHVVLIHPAGDLSMGGFTTGSQPAEPDLMQAPQQSMQTRGATQILRSTSNLSSTTGTAGGMTSGTALNR